MIFSLPNISQWQLHVVFLFFSSHDTPSFPILHRLTDPISPGFSGTPVPIVFRKISQKLRRCYTRQLFSATWLRNAVARQVADKIAQDKPKIKALLHETIIFSNLATQSRCETSCRQNCAYNKPSSQLQRKYCVASCRKSSLVFYLLQRCEIRCSV